MPLPTLYQIKSVMAKIAAENDILKEAKNTWCHSMCVWNFAQKIGKLAIKNGYKVDLKFLKLVCFIHDLGRMKTGSKASRELLPAVSHGYIGYKLALKHGIPKKLAEVCRRHAGGTGLQTSENKKFSFGKRSTFARTIEEKILGYSDCRTFRCEIAPFKRAYDRFKKYPGQSERLLKLQKFIEKITNSSL